MKKVSLLALIMILFGFSASIPGSIRVEVNRVENLNSGLDSLQRSTLRLEAATLKLNVAVNKFR